MADDCGSTIVVAPTFYATKVGFELAKQCCREAAKAGIHLLLVDASSLDETGRELVECRTIGSRQLSWSNFSLQKVKRELPCEKVLASLRSFSKTLVDLSHCKNPKSWREIVDFMIQEKADICNPRRATQSFIHTYPIEQWHSEQFGNLYLDSLAHQVGFPSVDGTMGPIVLSATFADHWLHFEGELWDAQIVSKVRAQRWHGAKVSSYEFDYKHHLAMKGEEEGVPKWTEKHLFQLNFLFEHVGIALKETEESR